MPKISEEKRLARRMHILKSAWTCFLREGLQATTIENIIRESGLSAGAVYGYFKSKDELILAALESSMAGLRAALEPILQRAQTLSPNSLLEEIISAIDSFSRLDGIDRKRVALLGWAESQRSESFRASLRGTYLAFLHDFATVATEGRDPRQSEATGSPEDVAKTMLAIILGFVAQAAIVGGVDAATIGRGLRELYRWEDRAQA